MQQVLTAAQMRGAEAAAMRGGRVGGLELMERAGRGTVAEILRWRPELGCGARRALVLCGPGNNGGDGFVVARLLHARGWTVEVVVYGRDPQALDALPPDAATNARRWRDLGGIAGWDDAGVVVLLRDGGHDLVVDALFGTGLTRPLGQDTRKTAAAVRAGCGGRPPRHVAVDLPSGVCTDSGTALGEPFAADFTVTFHAPKLAHVLIDPRAPEAGALSCGALHVVDIGLPPGQPEQSVAILAGPPPAARLAKRPGQHKYDHGHALVLSGGVGRGGAARLAARAALRIGAGLVTVGCPPAAIIENAARLDAIMLRPVRDAAALAELLVDGRINAVCAGPGLGVGERTRALVATLLDPCEGRRPAAVLDADVLTSFAADPSALFALLHPACVLTPHPGEFGRLFPDLSARLAEPAVQGPAFSRVDAARAAAARAGCTVLLKGADTVVATPDVTTVIHAAVRARAVPWLATAGAGDVLAGLIAGLLARGHATGEAATHAAWLHAEAARAAGPGLIAEDLPERLPGVLAALGAGASG